MTEKRIKIYICQDHFERLEEGNPCHTCPSMHEHKDLCMAMSETLDAEEDRTISAVLGEVESLRKLVSELVSRVANMENHLSL